ncbi:MAG TPA: glycosyltransferase N-terminal domain-containing protein [Gammaproteobacteria bacterium]
MSLLLDLGYLLGFLLAAPWLVYRLVRDRGWAHVPARFGVGLGPAVGGAIWLHGSSAGEVSLLRPLVARLEQDRPDTPLVISTYTATGLEAARKAYPRHRVILFPLDFSFVVRRFLARFEPELVVIVESEFWPNFLLAARRRGVPVAVLNGKVSEKSSRAYRRTGIVPRVLRELTLIAVQSDEHARRFRGLGVPSERIHVTGNMKYDLARGAADDDDRRALRERLGYAPDDVVVIGGSLHPGEPEALVAALDALGGEGRAALVLVPRYPADAAAVAEHVEARGRVAVTKTRIDRGEAAPPGRGGVLVVDTVGELGRLYAAADIAFVGGSLFFRGSNKGGHNLMEPAILGVPVLFGPYNFSFKETVEDLLARDAGILVRDAAELERALEALVADERRRRTLGERGRRVVLGGQGATARNYVLLRRIMDESRVSLQAQAVERTMPRASGHLDSR